MGEPGGLQSMGLQSRTRLKRLSSSSSQRYGFSSNHVWMWGLDHKEGWAMKNWCLCTLVLEKTLESPLDCKIKPVNPKGNQSWILIGRTDAEAEAPILWPPDVESPLIGKVPDAGKDWSQKKRVTEDEMVRQHYWLNGRKREQTQKDREVWSAAVHGATKSQTWLSDRTATTSWLQSGHQ